MMGRPLGALLTLLLAVSTLAVPGTATAGQRQPRGIPGAVELSADPDLAAWQRLQYGMFIHWGIYSELGGVWQDQPVTSGYSEQIQMWANISEADYRDVAHRWTRSTRPRSAASRSAPACGTSSSPASTTTASRCSTPPPPTTTSSTPRRTGGTR
ncbi:hypothetical protein GCM10022225_30430 [Plantactinospora mayteni]|uniref:Alpha-L-fucosidase n=1 Tax=Plantactinospora mayteni TaxID=566021 RepID=A0ABQ4EVJ1_9ACTN|nr:hypothetical protein [Plantactinospora mayteni]GIG98679.1 hypothetical protein Pma05_52520 [Plantactinospora mayteni]